MGKKSKLIVVIGPTGVGKTEVTLKIAERYQIPVINADSRQIFKELPIGTAAPTIEQQAIATHYFVATHHITDYFSASTFEEEALQLILENPRPLHLLSGGSMLYVDALCKGIDPMPTIREDIRNLIMQRLANEGLAALTEELKTLDPEHWQIVDKQNPRRVVHALEICHQTGKTYTSFRTNTTKERPFDLIKIGLNRPREELYTRINRRVEEMIDNGLIQEALKIYPHRTLNALNTVGYKETFDYLDGLTTLQETITRIQNNTRKYARKQITWFKKDPQTQWFHPEEIHEILNFIDKNTQ